MHTKLKAKLRKTAARTVDALWAVIGTISQTFTPTEGITSFVSAGYDPN